MNQIKIWNDIHYIVIDELPEEQREKFKRLLLGQTCPIIETEINEQGCFKSCAFAYDYMHWLDWFRKEAKIYD